MKKYLGLILILVILIIFSGCSNNQNVLNGKYKIVSSIRDGQSEIMSDNEVIIFSKDGTWQRAGEGGNWHGKYIIEDNKITFSDYENEQGEKQDTVLTGDLEFDGENIIITYDKQLYWQQRIVVYEKIGR